MNFTDSFREVFLPNEQDTMTIMEVDPGELVVDWKVSDGHVQDILNSLPSHNNQIVFPPYVWLHGLKVIDGLHRLVAAQLANLSRISIIVVDVSESRFWDLRIMAAKPHHSVESDRLYAWMTSCWESDWGKTNAKEEVANHLWQLFRNENYRQAGSFYRKLDRASLQGEQADLYDWFSLKSLRWGIPVESLADRIIAFWNIQNPNPEVDKVATKYNLTLPERNHLQTEVAKTPVKPVYVEKWVQTGMEGKLAESIKQEKAKKQAEAQPRQRRISEEQQRRRDFTTVRDALNHAGDSIRKVSHLLENVPDSASLLAAHLAYVRNLIDKQLEGTDEPIEQILAENARLHRENAELRIKCAGLERSLKQQSQAISSDVIAWSSVELPR